MRKGDCMQKSSRESRQRKFYRDLFPFSGQHMAAHLGGYTPPALEGQVAELKESFRLWQQVSASGADDAITDAAWWFTGIADPHRRASMSESMAHSTQLTAFAVGVLGQLLEAGHIKWADDDMKLPEIKIEAEGFTVENGMSDDQEIDVARLLRTLEDDSDE